MNDVPDLLFENRCKHLTQLNSLIIRKLVILDVTVHKLDKFVV